MEIACVHSTLHSIPVTCVIMQKNGAGFYAGSSVYWDNSHDGKLSKGGDQTTVKQYFIPFIILQEALIIDLKTNPYMPSSVFLA